jgi:hypothetical protein
LRLIACLTDAVRGATIEGDAFLVRVATTVLAALTGAVGDTGTVVDLASERARRGDGGGR